MGNLISYFKIFYIIYTNKNNNRYAVYGLDFITENDNIIFLESNCCIALDPT